MTKFHDPRREIETLRDHLASHDKPLAFLIGAGASFAARDLNDKPLIPCLAELGELCQTEVEKLGTKSTAAYATFGEQLRASLERDPNIEEILSSVPREACRARS